MKIRQQITRILLALLLPLGGCSHSDGDSPPTPDVVVEGRATLLQISMPNAGTTSPEGKDEAESVVKTLWMNTLYPATAIPAKADKVDARVKNVAVQNPTMVTVNSGVRNVYTAVNLTDATLIAGMEGAQTASDMAALNWSLGDAFPRSPFVMSSVLKQHTLVADQGGTMQLGVKLQSVVARLDLNVQFDALSDNFKAGGKYEGWTIVLDHLQLCNLPATTPLFEGDAMPVYLARKQSEKLAAVMVPDAVDSHSWTCAHTFYLPENRFEDKTDMNQATSVVIYARALPPPGTAIQEGDTALALVYRIAVGNHVEAMRDFNLRRNNKYVLHIKLVGLDSAERVFIYSTVEEWIKDEAQANGLTGNPGDAIFSDYQLESNVLKWTEDARSIDQIGTMWNGHADEDPENSTINGEPWVPQKPEDVTMGEK